MAVAAEPPVPSTQPAAKTTDRIVPYAPGVRINWTQAFVEIDGEIVLRQGPLELFACSPHTREHESIVAVHARPLRIFEALGLIGLDPGEPVHYEESSGRVTAPRGAALRMDVVVRADGAEKVFGVHEWMRSSGGGRPLDPRDWVFAGSRRLSGDRFAADLEGTVVCVVDFDSALIALPETHTSDDAALWLEANTERIPPIGTPCCLRISSVQRGRTLVYVRPNGDLRTNERPVSVEEIAEGLRAGMTRDAGAHAVLVPENREAYDAARVLQERLANRGLKILLRPRDPPPTTAPSSDPW